MGRTKELLEDMFFDPRRSIKELLDEVEMLRQQDLKIAEEVAARYEDQEFDEEVSKVEEERDRLANKDFDWCNDSGYKDVFNKSTCECTAPQVNDGVCICGRPLEEEQ